MRERRIQLLPLFEDYDPVHSGCVSHCQVSVIGCVIVSHTIMYGTVP